MTLVDRSCDAKDPYLIIGSFTNEEAYVLMNKGIWMASGGYKWRNTANGGQYLAYGEYPQCKRATLRHTLESVRKVGKNDWSIVVFSEIPSSIRNFLLGKQSVS